MTDGMIQARVVSAEDVLSSICSCLPPEHQEAVKESVIAHFAGSWVYFPIALKKKQRNQEIINRLREGASRSTICREYRLSRMQLHRIVVRDIISARVAARAQNCNILT